MNKLIRYCSHNYAAIRHVHRSRLRRSYQAGELPPGQVRQKRTQIINKYFEKGDDGMLKPTTDLSFFSDIVSYSKSKYFNKETQGNQVDLALP